MCRAGAEVGEDLVDHRRLRDEGDDAHRAAAGGTGERVDLENLLQEDRPSASGLGRRDSWRGDDHGRCVDCGGLSLPSHPTRTVGIPAVVPRGDATLLAVQLREAEYVGTSAFDSRTRAALSGAPIRQTLCD